MCCRSTYVQRGFPFGQPLFAFLQSDKSPVQVQGDTIDVVTRRKRKAAAHDKIRNRAFKEVCWLVDQVGVIDKI